MQRHKIRIEKPILIGSFVISIVKWVILIGGLSLSLSILVLSEKTATGQLTSEIVSVAGVISYLFLLNWFIAKMFAGALDVSLATVLVCAAVDEEMFAREQRFIEADLLDLLDGIGEEQNEFHRENKEKIKNTREGWVSDEEMEAMPFTKVKPIVESESDNETNFAKPYSPRSPLEEIKEESIEDDHIIGRKAKYV